MMDFMKDDRLNEGYYHTVLDNGLTVLIYPMEHKTSAYALLSSRVGSATLDFIVDGKTVHVPAGSAHFLEHKMFENEDGVDAFELFSKTGASANAYTSFDKTCYLFESSLNIEESLRTIIRFVGAPYFTDQTVEKEQGIIGQEIKMYLDHPGWRQMFLLLGLLYHIHPIKEDIAGSVESIAEITAEKLYDFYHAFYNPTNMVLAVSGNIKPEMVLSVCEEEFSKKDWKRHETVVPRYEEPDSIVGRRVTEEMAISSPQFCLGFKEIPFEKGERVKKEIAHAMLIDLIAGETSDLYRRLYDEGLINSDLSSDQLSGDDYLATLFSAESEDPETAIEEIQKEIKRIRREGIDGERFLECKRAFLGDAIGEFEDVGAVATNLTYSYFKDANIYDMMKHVESITIDDLTGLLREMMRDGYAAASMIVPFAKDHDKD